MLSQSLAALLRGAVNGSTLATVGSTRTASTLASQLTGGVDETLGDAYEAFRFTMVGTELGGFAVNLKRDAGTTAGTIKAYLYTNNAGVPGTDISDTTTGLPTIVFSQSLSTGYASFQFRLPKTGLSNATIYWIVLKIESVAGGNIYLERRSSGTALYAHSTDAIAWTADNSKEPIYSILGHAGLALSGTADTGDGVYGQSTSGFGGRFISTYGPGLKADSHDNFGVGGTSVNGIGVRGSSNNNHAIQGVSTGAAGGQFITTAAGQPAVQAVSTTGPALQLVPGTGSFAQFFPTDASAGGSAGTWGFLGEEITLAGGVTTDSVGNLLPAGAIIDAVGWRWTQAMSGGTATAFQVGTAADGVNFENTSVTFALGNTGYGMNHWLSGGHAQAFAAATKVRITLNGTSAAGKIRVVVWYRVYTPPTA